MNAKKSNFGAHELEYLGYNITRTGIQPIAKKVQAIQAIKAPKTRKQLRGFIGMINFYRDMWKNRASLLAPLSALTSESVPYVWTDEHQKNFDAMKRVIGEKCYWPSQTLMLRSKYTRMRAKPKVVPSCPKTENQSHFILEK